MSVSAGVHKEEVHCGVRWSTPEASTSRALLPWGLSGALEYDGDCAGESGTRVSTAQLRGVGNPHACHPPACSPSVTSISRAQHLDF